MNMMQDTNRSSILTFLLGGGGLVLIIYGLKNASSIVSPILLAAIIAVTVAPLVGWLMTKGLPVWLTLLVTIGLLIALIVGLVLLLGTSANRLLETLPQYADSLEGQQEETQTNLESLGLGSLLSLPRFDSETIMGLLGSLLQAIISALSGVVILLLVLIFAILALPAFPSMIKTQFPDDPPVLRRFARLAGDLRQYLAALTGINLLVGLVDVVFLVILGVDFALLWGLLAFLLGYIPAVGFWLALIPPFLLALAEFGPGKALVVLVGYILINGGVQNFVQPKLMGLRVNLSPLVVVLSLVFWGWVLGPLGALLSVPMTVMVKDIVLEGFDDSLDLAKLLSGGTEPAEPAVDDASS
jgi:predicted PurR-regulated permease PerM